jgi:tryptophanyl-tRNA synthetase
MTAAGGSHKPLVFSGVQPTGSLHLGNYLGAIKNWVPLQARYDCIFCVVDMHAITVFQEPAELKSATRRVAAAYIASGIDPKKTIIFNQSQVSVHAELAWIFNCVVRMGWLNRMTQFKEKAGKHRENASAGLFVYPSLMAADVLAYKATHVPVGEDQKQHLELMRDVAQKFNNDFRVPGFFPLPEPLITGPAPRVMSLRDGRVKMSKSEPSDFSRINLTDTPDKIAEKIKKARTDPHPLPESVEGLADRPEADNLVSIYAALANEDKARVIARFKGSSFSAFKDALSDVAIAAIDPVRREMLRLESDPSSLDRLLGEGAARARAIAEPVLREVYDIVGFVHGPRG